MEMSVKGHHLDVSESLRAYAKRRVTLVLGEFANRLTGVDVRISDVNGPRGGVDKTCAMTLQVRGVGVVFVQARGSNAYSTVDSAASRVRSALVTRLGRHGHRRRRPSARVAPFVNRATWPTTNDVRQHSIVEPMTT
jgi:ribosomal subunit interface protein